MLTTTFLLAIAIATMVALAGMLFVPARHRQPTHLSLATIAVAAVVTVLTVLGLVLV